MKANPGVVLFAVDDLRTSTESIGMHGHFTDLPRKLSVPVLPEPLYPDEERRCAALRDPTALILIAAFVGVLLGVLLSTLQVSADVSALVNLPGVMFLHMFKCFVMPMIFTSLTTGVADMVLMGKVAVIGSRTAAYFIGLSLLSAMLSMDVAIVLRQLHPSVAHGSSASATAFLDVQCEDGKFWAANDSGGAVRCSSVSSEKSTRLQMVDLTSVVLGDAATPSGSSVTSQISGILADLLPNNIFESFQDGTLLSVIGFSVVFGAAAVKVSSRERSPLLAVLTQMNNVFFMVIKKLIDWSPLAVLSLVRGPSRAKPSSQIYPVVLYLAIRKNPFPYMRAIIPAALFAFGCASSIATLPVTLRCVEATREVSRGLFQFVITIGCSAHKNGAAMYYPAAVVFLVATAEQELELGWWQLCLIVFISLLGSLGTAPITSSSLAIIYSVWQTVYPSAPMPASFSYLVAMDWFIDRVRTVCNVVGDAYVARVIAEQVDEAFDEAQRAQ